MIQTNIKLLIKYILTKLSLNFEVKYYEYKLKWDEEKLKIYLL
jgi:hypothetical protein